MVPFNYHHLYYFYIIAEEGSVTKASQKLRIAQSSLSMQLGQFENFLGKKLFIREGKKLILSEDGDSILSYAKAIFDLGEELSDSLNDRSRKGQIKIQMGVSSFIPKAFVDTILTGIYQREEAPYINIIERSLDEMIKDLASHKLDMILNDLPYQASKEEKIQNHLIAKIPVALCANEKWANKIKRIPRDLDQIPIILPTAQSQTYHSIQEYFLSHKVKTNIIAEIQDIEIVRRLVLSGQGIAPMNEVTIQKAPRKEKLKILGKPDQLGIYDSIYLIKKQRKSPHPIVENILADFKFTN